MYTINLEEIQKLPGCRTEYQIGNTYCAWSKVCVSAIKESFIATPNLMEFGIGEMNPKAQRFFKEITDQIGKEKFASVMELNDAKGDWISTHEAAVKLAVQYALESGLVQLEGEDCLNKELRTNTYYQALCQQ